MSEFAVPPPVVAADRTAATRMPACAASGAQPAVADSGRAASQLAYGGACDLPTPWAVFRLHAFVDAGSGKEHLALTLGDVATGAPLLARVHSECMTGDTLFSQRCDCGAQLQEALQRIAAAGRGVVLYLRQEGRGIGLVNKIRAYQLQDAGADTVEANAALGFAADLRHYAMCRPMLDRLGVSALRLMTNNPKKIAALEEAAVRVTERVALVVGRTASNARYLATKEAKLGHLLGAGPTPAG